MIDSIGVLVAMREELAALRKRFRLDWTGPGDFLTGKFGPIGIQVALSGAGPERALEAARLLTRYGQPRLLLGLGLSGGLQPSMPVGTLLVASSAQTRDRPELAADPGALSLFSFKSVATGPVLTTSAVMVKASAKAEQAGRFPQCLAVDMETYSLAHVAVETGLPWVALRAISDSVSQDLPLDFNQYLDAKGQASIRAIAAKALLDWKAGKELVAFSRQVLTAREALVKRLAETLGVLALC